MNSFVSRSGVGCGITFRVGVSFSESLAGTEVDGIMKLGGWKREAMAKHYIGTISSGKGR